MSPLWPDLALARAAWADAVRRGLVEETQERAGACSEKARDSLHPLRRR
jgi:hypothetical protein